MIPGQERLTPNNFKKQVSTSKSSDVTVDSIRKRTNKNSSKIKESENETSPDIPPKGTRMRNNRGRNPKYLP